MYSLNKCKHQNRGFTLVELIVVLTIIAILSAIVAPSVLGYIDDANQKQYIIHARTAVTAAQTKLSTLYSSGKLSLTVEDKQKWKEQYDFPDDVYLSVATISDADSIESGREKNAYLISQAIYIEENITVYYDGTDYKVIESAAGHDYPIVFMNPGGTLGENIIRRR